VVLDATGRDIQGEGAVLRARGPVVRVELPGGLVGGAFTSARTAALRHRIETLVHELLEHLAGQPDDVVDLRRQLAMPLPAEVISQLFGVPEGMRAELCGHVTTAFDTGADPAAIHGSVGRVFALLEELVELRGKTPGDDLISAMLVQRDEHGAAFSHAEVVDTLSLMVAAGYETTANLLEQAVAALLTHPDQLDLVRGGARSWSDVIEETLRWQAPIAYLPLRYAVENIEIDGTLIPRGDAIIVSYAAAGRDDRAYGETADEFDITRPDKRHHSFGHGVHHCVGAPLARLEARIALPAIFARFPELSLAVPASELTPLRSLLTNGHTSLPVRLTRQGGSSAG